MLEAYIEVFEHTRILQAISDQSESGSRQINIFWPGQDEKKCPVDSSGLKEMMHILQDQFVTNYNV